DAVAGWSAAGGVVGDGGFAWLAGAAAARRSVALGVEGRAVGQDGVDLPGLAIGRALNPELVLRGVAAGGLAEIGRGKAGPGQPRLLGSDRAGVGDLNPEVVETAAPAGVFQQHQLQRRGGGRGSRGPRPGPGPAPGRRASV